MKKNLAILLVLVLAAMLTVGCTTTSPTSSEAPTNAPTATKAAATEAPPQSNDDEILPLRYYMPGAATQQADLVNVAITQKMQADGLNIDFQPMYIPWDQWVNKINIMLSSGEEFELLHIMEDYIPTSTYASRNGLTPLDALIDEYVPGMRALFDDILWDCAKVGGEIMTVPAFWRDNSGDGEGKFTYCVTRFEEYGLSIPTTTDEMVETLIELQEKQKQETGMTAYVYEHSNTRCPVAMHRAYDSWPFYASQDGVFMVTQDGTATLFFESEEFKMDCEFMNELYTEGLIHPDILNLPLDTINTYKQDGDYLMGILTGGADVLDDEGNLALDFDFFVLNPDGPYLCNLPLLNSNAIPSTATHPELGLQFLYWMYSQKDNQDLVLYGIEGQQWNPVGEDEYERIKDENNSNLYAFDVWMIEYVPMHRFDVARTTTQEEDLDYISNIHADNTVYSPVSGFNFNSEPVSVEFANMMAEYTTSILPIKEGVIPYEGNFEAALAKMKAAGCDAVIAEYQKQLSEYLASK